MKILGSKAIRWAFLFILAFIPAERLAGQSMAQFDLFLSVQPLPSPYVSDWELDPSLTYLEVSSDNVSEEQIILEVVMTEMGRGQMLFARSTPIQALPGPWSIILNNTDYLDWESLTYSDDISGLMEQTGRLPDGSYQFCVSVLRAEDELLLATTCGGFHILSPQPPFLIYPVMGEAVTEIFPVFQWTPVAWFSEVSYKFMLSEILEGQEPEDALGVNEPYFTTTADLQPNYPYGADAPPLVPGQHYAWQVRSVDADGQPVGTNQGYSEAGDFHYGSSGGDAYIEALAPGNACTGEVSAVSGTSSTTFSWGAAGNFEAFYVMVCPNPCGTYTSTPTPSTPAPTGTTTTTGGQTTTTTGTSDAPTSTGVQITPNPYSPTTGQDTAPTGDPLPGEVRDAVAGTDPGIGSPLYVSDAVSASPVSTGYTVYNLDVELSEFLEPGQAFTFYICGTQLYEQGAMVSDYQCGRYQPTHDEQGEPVAASPCPDAPTCAIKPEEKKDPAMAGGLDPQYIGTLKIGRDGFIPLGAIGKDYDQLQWECLPSDNCEETKSKRMIPLTGKVKFRWEIEGEGSFVRLGCLPDNAKSDEGDHVIFMPPAIYGFKKDEQEKTVTTKIKLTTIDDNPTQPKDADVEQFITIITKRKKDKHEYDVEVKAETVKLPAAPAPVENQGSCKAVHKWELNNDLTQPVISRPGVADNDKMVSGQWIVLEANDQDDIDQITYRCVTPETSDCNGALRIKKYEDEVRWDWKIVYGGGKFIHRSDGRFVIYEAPKTMTSSKKMIKVKIQVEVRNPESLQIADKKPEPGEIILEIYRPGIRLSFPPKDWRPEEDNFVELTSTLQYQEGGKWQDALAHMCRIHHFDLPDYSNEPGICMNVPVESKENKENKSCPDYLFTTTGSQETVPPTKSISNCKDKLAYALEAHSTKPVREQKIRLDARDYGAYGYVRSFANVIRSSLSSMRSQRPFYEPVPVKRSEVRHPDGRPKKKEYDDNRVSVPQDIDENAIPDHGWSSIGKRMVADPKLNNGDDDNEPKGDGYKGDGLSAYQEYRGFKVMAGEKAKHVRTNTAKKDLFIENPDGLPLGSFKSASGLQVHEINEEQYNTKKERYVNFRYKTAHVVKQRGLRLLNKGYHSSLLGYACLTSKCPSAGHLTPPNWMHHIRVYKDRVKSAADKHKMNMATKLAQVTAHELGHGCNVYHHGESPADNPGTMHGLCSGNVNCIMRYDHRCVSPDTIGKTYCKSASGTGYNKEPCKKGTLCYGDANTKKSRGNCSGQFRVSGRTAKYPKR